MEEAFADELQLLAHNVINKKPNCWNNLDTSLKQCYTNQIHDHNSMSIIKTLLIQMPKVTFTQFRNELAEVLGTHQHYKGNDKSVFSHIHKYQNWGEKGTIKIWPNLLR